MVCYHLEVIVNKRPNTMVKNYLNSICTAERIMQNSSKGKSLGWTKIGIKNI